MQLDPTALTRELGAHAGTPATGARPACPVTAAAALLGPIDPRDELTRRSKGPAQCQWPVGIVEPPNLDLPRRVLAKGERTACMYCRQCYAVTVHQHRDRNILRLHALERAAIVVPGGSEHHVKQLSQIG